MTANPTTDLEAQPVTGLRAGSPNSFPSPANSRLPQARRLSRSTKIVAAAVLAAVLGSGGALIYYFITGSGGVRADILAHPVRMENLQMTVTERGALESAANRDVFCRVKARSQGSTIATTIKWLIDDGSQVKQGQVISQLDDSGLQEGLKDQRIKVDQAYASMISADESLNITESQNFSDIETCKVKLDLARIDLRKYLEGEYERDKKDILGRMSIAKSDLEMWEERKGWSERMSKRAYVTPSQAQSDAAKLQSAQLALQKVEDELRVLESPEYGMKTRQVKSLTNDIEEAKRALDRAEKQAKAKQAQAEATQKAAHSVYQQELARMHDLEDEIRKCTILAPQDGIVVYYVPEQSRYGMGTKQSIINQGETVSEGQKMMQIPDLSKMVVNTKIHEAMVARVKGEQWRRTGFSDGVQAALFHQHPLSYMLSQFSFGQVRQDFADQYRAQEQELLYGGQDARIRIEAFNDVGYMKGHVKSVATVASQSDWLSSDVKVYQAMVSIDESHDGLKPQMSAEVTIYLDNRTESVVAVPVQALLGSASSGNKRQCYVMTKDGPELRSVTVGMSNEKMVEVLEGLSEGEEVALNPRALLTEKEKTKLQVAEAASMDASKEKGKGKGGKGKGGKGKGGKGKGGAGPGPGSDGPGGFAEMSPEERQQKGAEMMQKFQAATPAQRKQMLDEMPEERRDRVRGFLKQKGVQVAD